MGVDTNQIITSSVQVQTVKLFDFFIENKILDVDLIKIDIEGHEYKCLEGLFNNEDPARFNKIIRIKRIQIENHEDDMYQNTEKFEEINNLLVKYGFKAEKKIRHGFGEFYEYVYFNMN